MRYLTRPACLLALTGLASLHVSANDPRWETVSGTGIHYFSTSMLHHSLPTHTGKTERSTDSIDLFGDLNGRVIYHVTSEYDFVKGTLSNSGHQIFSGTVMGSAPVLILDDDFFFQVDLNTGETKGEVFLSRTLEGDNIKCQLQVTGTGFDEQGNGLAEYTGRCRKAGTGRPQRGDIE